MTAASGHHLGASASRPDSRATSSIEDHEAIRACLIELPRDVAKGGEERRKLHRDGDRQLVLQILDDLAKPPFNGQGRLIRISDYLVHVQLNRVGAGLFH
jgi:hypothetical protein